MRFKTIFTLGIIMFFSLSSVGEFKPEKDALPYQKVSDSTWLKEIRLKSLEDENLCIEHDIFLTKKEILE